MNPQSSDLNALVGAMMKLDAKSRQWQNVVAFIVSCYACRVTTYDHRAAMDALARLTDAEQAALIASVLRNEERLLTNRDHAA